MTRATKAKRAKTKPAKARRAPRRPAPRAVRAPRPRASAAQRHRLITAKGGGGLIVEAAFALARVPLEVEDLAWDDVGPASKRLALLNPLGQVPTLVLPDGSPMTESAAILLYLSELAPKAKLAPPPGDAQRAAFLRWLTFLVAAFYPTYTYGDDPTRWVGAEAGPKLRESTDAHREKLLRFLDAKVAGAPWFLGKRFSAIDLYLPVVRMWRPGPKWWAQNAPRLNAIADRCEALPAVARAFARNRA